VCIVDPLDSLVFVPQGHLFEEEEEEYAVCEVKNVYPEDFKGTPSLKGLVLIGVSLLAELYVPLINVLPYVIQRIDDYDSDYPGNGVSGLSG
jgi:hypothetical protein